MTNKIETFFQVYDLINKDSLSEANKLNKNNGDKGTIWSIPEIIEKIMYVSQLEIASLKDYQCTKLNKSFMNYRKQNEQQNFELETMQNLLNTAIEENKNYIVENKQLKNEILLNKSRFDEFVLNLKGDYQEKSKKLNQTIQKQAHTIESMYNDNRAELKIQEKIIERLKKYINLLKKELVAAKTIIKGSKVVRGFDLK